MSNGQPWNQDLRSRALVLLATFASLRWGEAIALRRCDVDLRACTVRVRASFVERSNGQILLGPPKSKVGMRVVGFPKVIKPVLQGHLSLLAGPEPRALVFPGAKGGPLRRGNFNKLSGWPHVARAIGAEGLHFYDLRHTGNAFAPASGAGLRDLMARMGHDSERAAIIYQHVARGRTRPSPRRWMHTSRLSRPTMSGGTMAPRACLCQQANCTNGAEGGSRPDGAAEAQFRELRLYRGAGDGLELTDIVDIWGL